MMIRDITERKQAEQALRESEARHRSLFMSLSEGFAYHEIILDRQGQPVDYRFLELNPVFENMTGLVREQVVGRTVREVMPGIEDFWIKTYGKVALTGSPIQFQYYSETLGKNYNVVTYSPEKYRFAVLFIDVTEQIRAEAQAQAQKTELEVHHRLIDLQEQAQEHIARELHDGPLQGLMALGFALQQVATDVSGQPVERPIRDMQTSLHSVIDQLRSFTGELRSPVLYKFGLAKAISSHLETFAEKHPELALQVQIDADDDAAPQSVRSGLYRIYQEALNNIVAHARATQVEIQLTQIQRSLQLEISDDGQGFTLPQDWLELVRSGHFGLVGMRERAESLGGQAEIISHPGAGTRVWVKVPL
jgi:PAS domain S-box-containing protein